MRVRAALAALVLAGLLGCGLSAGPPAWELPPPRTREGPVVPAQRLHRAALPNGVKLLILEDPRLPRVSLGVAVRRGAASVPPEQAGLASFSAELMRRGAGERDALALAEAVDALGATLRVSSGWDSAQARVAGLSRDLDALLEILADVVLRPRFDAEEAARLRGERLAALEKAKDDPATLARWSLLRALFPGHAYGLPQGGTPETVSRFNAEAAAALHRAVWVSEDAIFFASGDVQAAALEQRVADLFGDWHGGPAPALEPPAPEPAPPSRRVVVVDRPELVQARILLGTEGPRRADPERVAASLLNTVVGGGGFSSRITTAVRRQAGLAYFAYSSFRMHRWWGAYVAATATRVAEAGRVVSLLLSVLENARRDPPSAEELRHAQSYAVGRFALGLETSEAIVGALVELDVQGLPEDSLDTYRARVRAITQADVAREALRRLHPGRAVIVVVGPASVLTQQLEPFGPVEVVQP